MIFGVARRLGLLDPARVTASGFGLARWGATLGAATAGAAARHPRRAAVIDDRGELSYLRLDRRSTALAAGFVQLGLGRHDHLAILCRNHRGFVESAVAAAKASLAPIYLNTGFASSQLGDVLSREHAAAIVCDREFLQLVKRTGFDGPIVLADATAALDTTDTQDVADDLAEGTGSASVSEAVDDATAVQLTLHGVRRLGRGRVLRRPVVVPPVLLTSGTTGTPKGARFSSGADMVAAMGLLDRVPVQSSDVFVIAPPLFHAWGLAQLSLAISLGATTVLSSSFRPNAVGELTTRHGGTVLAVVPVMLQRMLADDTLDTDALAGLRIVVSSGSALPAEVVTSWHDRVGHNLYNLYGSTEVGLATVATPDDLRHLPDTAGSPIAGTVVKILDDSGTAVARGEVGGIFVGNSVQLDQYTGGGGKKVVDGLMSSGDVGYFDADGRLHVTGRIDDMIVSGGENVFPREVEELLLGLPGVHDAAVVGVADSEFGQRLAAFVVRGNGDEGDSLTEAGLRDAVRNSLARHKVPRVVKFIEELPRTTTGKVLRRRLVEAAAEADGVDGTAAEPAAADAPQ